MTTLKDGREQLLAAMTETQDPDFKERMSEQIVAMTTGENPYYVWQSLPQEQQEQFGSVEHHPEGLEKCIDQWLSSGASERWGKEHEQMH